MTYKSAILMFLLGLSATLVGCKIEIVVREGGQVETYFGSPETHHCQPRKTCVIDVVDIFFRELFIATPDEGWEFDGWKNRQRGFCGGKKGMCGISTEIFASNQAMMRFLESDELFDLDPVFRRSTLVSNGRLALIPSIRNENVIGGYIQPETEIELTLENRSDIDFTIFGAKIRYASGEVSELRTWGGEDFFTVGPGEKRTYGMSPRSPLLAPITLI